MPEKKDSVDEDLEFVNELEISLIDQANAHRRADGSFDQTGEAFMRILRNFGQAVERIDAKRADK